MLFIFRERIRKENASLKKGLNIQAAQLRHFEEKIVNDAKMNEYKINDLETRLTKANYELSNLEQKLLGIFTKGQIAKLKSGIKRTNWTEEDITQGITLYAASAKLYKLLYKQHFPLPAIRTLQAWAQKVHISPGLLIPVFKLLSASTHMNELDKVCALSFDEAKIRKTYCYDKSSDTTLAPASYVQVVMIRGQ